MLSMWPFNVRRCCDDRKSAGGANMREEGWVDEAGAQASWISPTDDSKKNRKLPENYGFV